VRERRPRVCRQGCRRGRALHRATGNAIVLCVDEKPSIQALERAQGYLKLPNGRALTGHSHDYKRNGTSTLFAAFEVATGTVMTAHKNRRRRIDFLEFMNSLVAAYPDTAIHVILDNLNTHKPKNDRWLKRHPKQQADADLDADGGGLALNLIGSRVKLNPVWIIFAVFAFGYLFGLVGLLVAVPLAAAIGVLVRFALKQYGAPQTKFAATLVTEIGQPPARGGSPKGT
jgi:hypothetical protein